MNKVLKTYSLLISACLLLSSCSRSEDKAKDKKETTETTKQNKDKKMARTKTDSGLEYEILQAGEGKSPEVGKTVVVHYTGWLNKGDYTPGEKAFDSSVARGEKFDFKIGVGNVIAGWDEGVMSMKIGEKRRLYIPSDMGYGARGAGNVIPPNADLIFDVELFDVK